jgi:hypothetical protein
VESLLQLTVGALLNPPSYKHVVSADVNPTELCVMTTSQAFIIRCYHTALGCGHHSDIFKMMYLAVARCGGTVEAIRLGWAESPAECDTLSAFTNGVTSLHLQAFGEQLAAHESATQVTAMQQVLRSAFEISWALAHHLPRAMISTPGLLTPSASMYAASIIDACSTRILELQCGWTRDVLHVRKPRSLMDQLCEAAYAQAHEEEDDIFAAWAFLRRPGVKWWPQALADASAKRFPSGVGTSKQDDHAINVILHILVGEGSAESVDDDPVAPILAWSALMGQDPRQPWRVSPAARKWLVFARDAAVALQLGFDESPGYGENSHNKRVAAAALAKLALTMATLACPGVSVGDTAHFTEDALRPHEFADVSTVPESALHIFRCSVAESAPSISADETFDRRSAVRRVQDGRRWLAHLLWFWRLSL